MLLYLPSVIGMQIFSQFVIEEKSAILINFLLILKGDHSSRKC